jgi:3-methyladenine DNA glycosylase Tag
MPVEAPQQITTKTLSGYLDVLTKAVFQSGISWKVVEAKWPGTREAFADFEPEHVADLTPDEIDELARDARLIRNRRKIEATSQNAATMRELAQQHGSFRSTCDRSRRMTHCNPTSCADSSSSATRARTTSSTS